MHLVCVYECKLFYIFYLHKSDYVYIDTLDLCLFQSSVVVLLLLLLLLLLLMLSQAAPEGRVERYGQGRR